MCKNDETIFEIESFIKNFKKYEAHIESDYVLFLFQNYNYSPGVEWFCKKLGFRQEALTYFI
jgi:hypothetical protein